MIVNKLSVVGLKKFMKVMISIALFQHFSSRQFLSIVEVTAIRTYSRKTNKLRNIYTIALGARSIAIKKYSVGNFYKNC